MAIAVEKLEDQLNCSICLETYTDPKQLQCNHVYCQLCLVKLVMRDRQGKLSLTCPSCRHVTPVPASGVSGLQAAFRVNNLLEILEEHKKGTASLEKVKSTPTGSLTPQGSGAVCPEHGKELEFYCETCGEMVCFRCIKNGEKHHSHDYEKLGESFESYKREIMSLLEPMEEQILAVKKALEDFDELHDEISKQQVTIEADIHSTITRLHRTLDIRKTELIGQVHQLTQAKLKSLAVQRDEIETTQAQLSSCLLLMKDNLKQSDQVKPLLKKGTIEQVKELTTAVQPDMLEPSVKADMTFSALADLYTQCQEYGMVYAEGLPDPSKSLATGTGVDKAAVGEKTAAVLQTLNSDSQPCKISLASISCELVSEISGTRVEGTIKRRRQSEYEISYQPTIKGRHQLHIKVEGQHIRGSPFSVSAHSPMQKLSTPILAIEGVRAPGGVAINQFGEVIVTDHLKHHAFVYSPSGKRLRTFGTHGSQPGQFRRPAGVAVDDQGNILITDCENHRIQKFSAQGEFITAVGTQGCGPLQFHIPRSIAVHPSNGKIYVACGNDCVQILNPDLSFFDCFGETGRKKGQFSEPRQLAFDNAGNVYVTDCDNDRIQVFTAEGNFLRMFGRYGEERGYLNQPWGVAVDSTNNRVYVSEKSNFRISVFTTTGQFVKCFGIRGSDIFGRLAMDSSVLYVCIDNGVQLF